MRILLTFTGFNDPYSLGLVGDEPQAGPILSLTRARDFDRVILFSTPNTARNTVETCKALSAEHPTVSLDVREIPLVDPTDYLPILKALRSNVRQIVEDRPGADYYVSVASGTPQMHACLVLLVASGEIPATILHVRPPRFVTKDRPLVSEIELTSPEFPTVRASFVAETPSRLEVLDIATTVRELGLVADHPTMRKALETVAGLAASSAPILILGETGTGKELVAKLIHRLSGRPSDRFVALNCAAIPSDLVESVLFGHMKGAFTGAIIDQRGKFDLADGGTLFLDELADLPVTTQAKLLRVLQDGLVEPVGSGKAHEVDVRIVAATNKNLRDSIRQGTFREDLYYRLNVGVVVLPALRERRSDIPKIALHVLDRVNAGLKNTKRLAPSALTRLQNHSWPGNVRDLENVIERSALLAGQAVLEADDLLIEDPVTYADPLAALPDPNPGFSVEAYLTSVRKQLMLRALELSGGNQSEAARLLGISPQAVHKFVQHENRHLQPALKKSSTSVKARRPNRGRRSERN